MQYQRLTDDTSIIVGETGESQLFSSSLDRNRTIGRIRKLILIFLSIQLILCPILITVAARLLTKDNEGNFRQGIRSLPSISLSIIYYGCGLFVVYRYHHLGIYLLAWLGYFQYVSLCAEIFINMIFIAKHPSQDTQTKFGKRMSLIILIISTFQMVLLVSTLKLTFKLNRLIKLFKREVLEQL